MVFIYFHQVELKKQYKYITLSKHICAILDFLIYGTNADEEKKMNASYIISAARKLGCSVFLLPEDILEVTLIRIKYQN